MSEPECTIRRELRESPQIFYFVLQQWCPNEPAPVPEPQDVFEYRMRGYTKIYTPNEWKAIKTAEELADGAAKALHDIWRDNNSDGPQWPDPMCALYAWLVNLVDRYVAYEVKRRNATP